MEIVHLDRSLRPMEAREDRRPAMEVAEEDRLAPEVAPVREPPALGKAQAEKAPLRPTVQAAFTMAEEVVLTPWQDVALSTAAAAAVELQPPDPQFMQAEHLSMVEPVAQAPPQAQPEMERFQAVVAAAHEREQAALAPTACAA